MIKRIIRGTEPDGDRIVDSVAGRLITMEQ